MLDLNNHPVLLVMAIAVITPLLAEIPLGFRLPAVMLEMMFGIVVGPHVLGFVGVGGRLGWLGGTFGLAALFFMAGMELDLNRVQGRPLRLAIFGWILSFSLGLAVAGSLYELQLINVPLMVSVALSTTALGMFLPILKDAGDLDTEFGRQILAAGAAGEFLPIVVVSLVFTRDYSGWLQVTFMLALVAITCLSALAVLRVSSPKIIGLLSRTLHSSSQLPVRLTILVISSFFILAEELGLDAVLGAFAAGLVFRIATGGKEGKLMRSKIEAICFGFLMPFFFVTSGINFDLGALLQSGKAMLLIPLFLTLFFVVRGTPVLLLYRNDLAKGEQLPFALYSSTALPMVMAITHIGVETKRMQSDIATALVSAAILSVILFPAIGGTLRSRNTSQFPAAET